MSILNKQQSALLGQIPSLPSMLETFSKKMESKFPSMMQSISFTNDQEVNSQSYEKMHNNIPDNIFNILKKKQTDRTQTENSQITKYVSNFIIFHQMSDKLNHDFAKHILKVGKAKIFNQGDVICFENKRIKHIDILLVGQVQSFNLSMQEQQNIDKKDIWIFLNEMTQIMGKQFKKYKQKLNTSNHKKDLYHQQSVIVKKSNIKHQIEMQTGQKLTAQCFLSYQQLKNVEPVYNRTITALSPITLVFSISLDQFYQILLSSYNSKINQIIKSFRKFSVFNAFDSHKLKIIIQKLQTIILKKGQYFYKQGQQAKCFYMLLEGEVQIQKTIQLFAQNPNNLYKSRIKVSRQKITKKIQPLPYADFNGVFNYTPTAKIINLAIITPICIFGQEQLLQNKTRQVNAKITSLNASAYRINLNDIQEVCSKISTSQQQKKMSLSSFLIGLQQSQTLKKILFRQNQLSELVEHQNKNKYTSIFQGSSKKPIVRLQSASKTRSIRSSKSKLNQLNSDIVPPKFNNFNFNDFLQENQQKQISTNNLTEEQKKIVKMTHMKFPEQIKKSSKDKTIRIRCKSRDNSLKQKQILDSLNTMQTITNKSVIFPRQKSKTQIMHKMQIQIYSEHFTNPYFNYNTSKSRVINKKD